MEDLTDSPRAKPRLSRWLPVAAIGILAATFVLSGAYEQLNFAALARHHDQLQSWVALQPLLAGAALVLAIAAMLCTGLPGAVLLVVAAGLLFGIVPGALIAVAGNALGSLVLFLTARRFFLSGGEPPALVARIRAGFSAHPVSYAFFLRLVPVFPYGASSVALAWLGCPLPLFVISSALGGLPGTLIYSALGAGLEATIRQHQDIDLSVIAQPRFAIPLAALAIMALLPVMLGAWKKKPERS